jgi:hypothetical protein
MHQKTPSNPPSHTFSTPFHLQVSHSTRSQGHAQYSTCPRGQKKQSCKTRHYQAKTETFYPTIFQTTQSMTHQQQRNAHYPYGSCPDSVFWRATRSWLLQFWMKLKASLFQVAYLATMVTGWSRFLRLLTSLCSTKHHGCRAWRFHIAVLRCVLEMGLLLALALITAAIPEQRLVSTLSNKASLLEVSRTRQHDLLPCERFQALHI